MWEDEGEAVGNCVEMRGDEECAVALLILILIMMQDTCRIELFLGLKVISDVGTVRGLSLALVLAFRD